MNKNSIILCSGGLDSVTTAYYVKKKLKYGKLILLFFDYGQRTLKQERKSVKKFAKKLDAEFKEMKLIELARISGSLINNKEKAKKILRVDLKDSAKESEKYYVPCRNLVFLSYALGLAESLFIKEKKVYDIFTGFKCEGKDAYPDTTPEFVKQINKLSKICCIKEFRVIAPLIKKDKDEIIRLGEQLGVEFEDTFSCYIGTKGNNSQHCGVCLSCRLRQEAFYWANVRDKTRYNEKMKDYRKV